MVNGQWFIVWSMVNGLLFHMTVNGQWFIVSYDCQWSMVNGLLFHMTQPTSRSIIKAIACSKPTTSEH